jgi:hypothetical protein
MKVIIFNLDEQMGSVELDGEELIINGDSKFVRFLLSLYVTGTPLKTFVSSLPNRLRSRITAVNANS